ncbi:hypothetical protein TCDM_09054 [Trypanosoma cruzi Dm28c]|uniref:Uncharacterized protein n=1 Tax=Trypanosoma cruzi Dm28c TaxID=1416333 RepID=V5D6W0_TRYCR|nr:hypothetical protein TCDM_09054 [Trypanosoma cruzi Dm28c]
MTPRAVNTLTHSGHRAPALPFQHGMQAHVPLSPKHSCRALCKYLFSVCWKSRKKRKGNTGRQINTARGTADGSNKCGAASASTITHGVSTHTHRKRKQKTRRQGVAVCVALRVSASPDRKEKKQEGKKCVLRPAGPRRTPTRHGSLSAPFVAAPPHACSRRGAQGRRHERVGGCASGAVGRETHGTPHRKSAEETIKRGKSRKEKPSIVIAPEKKKKGWWMGD